MKGSCLRCSVASVDHILSGDHEVLSVLWALRHGQSSRALDTLSRVQADGGADPDLKGSQPLVGQGSFVPVSASTRPSVILWKGCCVPLTCDSKVITRSCSVDLSAGLRSVSLVFCGVL